MQFTTAFLTTALSFAAGTYAWAQAADGTWVANNNWYTLWYNNGDSEWFLPPIVVGTVSTNSCPP